MDRGDYYFAGLAVAEMFMSDGEDGPYIKNSADHKAMDCIIDELIEQGASKKMAESVALEIVDLHRDPCYGR